MPILHRTRTLPALLPRYVGRFACIGPACEDNCCTGWQVQIDKKTYKAYRQAGDSRLGTLLATHVVRQRGQPGDLDYGRIELDPASAACPILQERLCAVQSTLGESYLSHTCFSYPRMSRDFGGQFEQGMTLSCPETARLALLAPDAFDFVQGTITVRTDVVDQVVARHGMTLEQMNEVRIFCLKLMRTEGVELWQKLAVLGVLCESLTGALSQGKHAAIPALLEDVATLVGNGQMRDALADMPPNHAAQAMVFAALWGGKTSAAPSPAQRAVIGAIAEGLGADPATGSVTSEQLIERYTRGAGRLPEALAAAPHLLEHYILNEMFSLLFPFDGADPYASYLQLVARFGLLRLMLAAQCNGDGALPDAAALVGTVQVFCRRFQHDLTFAGQVNQSLQNSGWSTLEKLYGFLRS